MSDKVPAWIEIGGNIPREHVPALIECIRSAGVSGNFGSSDVVVRSAADLVDLTRDATGNLGTLKLYDERARNGEFRVLECFLEEHGIGFDRRSDGGAEFSPEIVRFRPGWPAPTTGIRDNLGREVIPIEYVEEALEMLRAGKIDEAIAHLAAFVGEDIPALTPLEILA